MEGTGHLCPCAQEEKSKPFYHPIDPPKEQAGGFLSKLMLENLVFMWFWVTSFKTYQTLHFGLLS